VICKASELGIFVLIGIELVVVVFALTFVYCRLIAVLPSKFILMFISQEQEPIMGGSDTKPWLFLYDFVIFIYSFRRGVFLECQGASVTAGLISYCAHPGLGDCRLCDSRW
jgi:hypothetical protein